MIDSVARSRAAFQFVVGKSEVGELSDARLSIFIKVRPRWQLGMPDRGR